MIGDLLRLLRPAQWVKNLFILMPLFFGGKLLDGGAWAHAWIAFAAFSLMASAIYCLNDIVDVNRDRNHPRKCNRPIASGKISIPVATLTLLGLIVASQCIVWFGLGRNAMPVSIVITLYLILNIGYSLKLKQIAVLDVIIIAIGFVLRLVAGGIACNITLSPWIVLMTFLLTLFIAFSKRRDDVLIYERVGIEPRKNTSRYNLAYINITMGVLASVTMVCYIMYTLSPTVIANFNNQYIYISSILVLAGLIRYLQIAIVDGRTGSPTEILLHDVFIQICCICWLMFFVVVLYCK